MYSHKRSLATLITRIIILVLGVLSLGIFVQSYYFSQQIITQEITRTKQQTSSLLQNLFNYHIAAIQIHHDSNAKNEALIRYLMTRDTENLAYFFSSLDQSEPTHTPEFRFFTVNGTVRWDDGSAHFYGIDDILQQKIASKVPYNGRWYYFTMQTLLGQKHMLVRRVPLIENQTGEVLGQSYIAVVLDNNFTLIDQLQAGSNSEDIMLLAGNKLVADSFDGSEGYDDVLNQESADDVFSHVLVTRTHVNIDDNNSDLVLVSVQNNTNVANLQRQHYLGICFSIMLMILMAMLMRKWIQQQVNTALDSLMKYTQAARNQTEYIEFEGSNITEFADIGYTLQNTFEQLDSQRKSFRDLFNFALSPTMVWSETGVLIQMNPAAKKELWPEFGEPENKPAHPHFQLFQAKLFTYIKMTAQGSPLTGINVPIGNKVFRWNLSPISVEDGITGVIVQGQDITTLIEAEEQSNLARSEAEESAKARADFLAKMSHEIRTPLNGILGVSQLLKREIEHPGHKKQIQVLINSGEHLLAVMNDILDFSKLEHSQFTLEKRVFRFADIVDTLDHIYRPPCREKGVDLIIDNEIGEDEHIYSDQVRLNQILFNLVSNATKFTSQGSISIRFKISQSQYQTRLKIWVHDTGIGIQQDKLSRIFEPFVQADSSTTREFGGSGLGLTIVKSLVDMLQGHIDVSSAKGSGTTFYVDLPIEREQRELRSYRDLASIPAGQLFKEKVRILLVEDNHTNAFVLQAFCSKYNVEVTWVKDGREAIKSVEEHEFELILMDNQLPIIGGIETTEFIRQEMKVDTPIFACTADTQESTKAAFLTAGANQVLVKPINEQIFYKAMLEFYHQYYDSNLAVSKRSGELR